ncbi:uncharacterized protein LOC111879449 isoform X1 [Lactuca sativa]|uniref:Uncharacterized protein n=1 Tax=Lactuca sativa TaxID=4236 RepID=A0A9R1UDH3_LACSA|nr:uncharacterized protein LOC111879449 isoform X1 [Lactuca sativa]XP_023731688.1 uncharacterized protein LOC111879449 isoform X1 [Lactuca sativa]XP_023731690.1 uncharacterized protein LOC111879449 isoform X1 [Lactuca sativa]KAJ0185100.1 hypothetical protein LSAT_V11C900467000 [Lactuca sativa]
MKTQKREQKTSKGVKEKAPSLQENRNREPTECSKMGNRLHVSKHHERKTSAMAYKNQRSESIVHEVGDLVKHSSNLPSYLQCGGKTGNIQEKTFDFGVLDWNLLQNWKSNTNCNTKPSISINNPAQKSKSPNLQALLQLRMKNDIPFFKLMADSSNNTLVATVKKLPSGKDDSSLTYTFYSVHETKNKIVGHMKISSSYHAEFSGLERDLFVERESVLYDPDLGQSELAAIVVKNTSKEKYGGLGRSKSTVVVLPGDIHTLPKSGKPSSLINRWKSGGACDCGGWDIGCELKVLTNQSESTEIVNPSTSDHIDLCYQGMGNNNCAFSLASLENGVYSVEYNASISLLQVFSICVAVVSSQKLTHIFQVNHFQDVFDFSKSIITRHRNVKSQTIVHNKIPPVSPIGRL